MERTEKNARLHVDIVLIKNHVITSTERVSQDVNPVTWGICANHVCKYNLNNSIFYFTWEEDCIFDIHLKSISF